jgi:hypothetical protein
MDWIELAQIYIEGLFYTCWLHISMDVLLVLGQDHYKQIEIGIAGIYVVWKQFVLSLHVM